MSLMDAPEYDPTADNRLRNLAVGGLILFLVLVLLSLAGYALGHGWLFSNLGYEHRVNRFFDDLEAKNYAAAYDLYTNGQPDAGYPLQRFTEDWTIDSPVKGSILSHHVDISKTDGSGLFGTGVIVAVRVNLQNGGGKKVFMYVNRADKTMTWPAPHELEYN
jgi:hypothetical protein